MRTASVAEEPRPRSEAEERPFTLVGHRFLAAAPSEAGQLDAMPPKFHPPGSSANYWLLDESLIANMQWQVTPLDPTVPIFKQPHACVEGVVQEVINETDGDHHIWLGLDGSKARLACEITPQQAITPPAVGAHVRIYGILRYDLQHGWSEIHPVDFLELIP